MRCAPCGASCGVSYGASCDASYGTSQCGSRGGSCRGSCGTLHVVRHVVHHVAGHAVGLAMLSRLPPPRAAVASRRGGHAMPPPASAIRLPVSHDDDAKRSRRRAADSVSSLEQRCGMASFSSNGRPRRRTPPFVRSRRRCRCDSTRSFDVRRSTTVHTPFDVRLDWRSRSNHNNDGDATRRSDDPTDPPGRAELARAVRRGGARQQRGARGAGPLAGDDRARGEANGNVTVK